ncbi:MAG: hypothetical protein V4615_04860 [Bacteroidota bacterium]
MARKGRITEVIDIPAVKSQFDILRDYINQFIEQTSRIKPIRVGLDSSNKPSEYIKGIEAMSKVQSEQNKIIRDGIKANQDYLKADKEVANIRLTNAKAAKLEADATLQSARAKDLETKSQISNTKAKENAAKYEANLNKELDKTATQRVKEEEKLGKLNNEYEQLKHRYNLAANSAKQLAVAKGLDNEETKEAIAVADQYYNQLVKIERAVGQSQRTVGQYERATFALSQIIREAPSFMYSFQTGLLGISNNIGPLLDEYKKLKDATGSSASAFGILAKSLFSPINLISIAIAFLPKLIEKIGEWTGASFDAAKAQKEVAEAATKLNDIIKKQSELYAQNTKEQIKYLQRQLDVAEKTGVSAERLFGLRKSIAMAESNLTDSQIIEQARQISADGVVVDSKEKAMEALKNAQLSYGVTLQALYTEQLYIQQQYLSAQAIGDSDEIELLKKKQETIQANIGFNESALSRINDLVTASSDNQKQQDALAAEQAKLNSDERRKLALASARIETELIAAKNEAVLNNDRSTLDQRLSALRSNLKARKQLIQAEKADVLNDPGATSADRTIAIREAAKNDKLATMETQKAILDIKEDYRLRDLQAIKEAKAIRLTAEAELQQELSDSLLLGLQKRLQAQVDYATAQKKILDDEFKLKLQQAGISDAEIQALIADKNYKVKSKKITNAELETLQIEHENNILKLSIQAGENVNAIIKSNAEKRKGALEGSLSEIERIYNNVNVSANIAYAGDLIALNESYSKKKISQQKYNEDRLKLENKYNLQTNTNLIRTLEDQLRYFTNAQEVELQAKKEVEGLKQQLAAATTDAERKGILDKLDIANADYKIAKDLVAKKIALENQLAEAKKAGSDASVKIDENQAQKVRDRVAGTLSQLAQVNDQITALGGALSERRMQAINAEQDALEKKYARDLEIIEQTSVNDVEAKERKALADARYAAAKDQLDKRERQENIRKAKFDKEQAIFSIILNTAAAIVKALPNVPLSIGVGIVGALQLATAIARPVPKYAKGKPPSDNYEGLAYVGDGGRKELILREDGTTEITPDKSTLTWVGRNDVILPSADETMRTAMGYEANRILSMTDPGNMFTDKNITRSINNMRQDVVKAIKNIPQPVFKKSSPMKEWVHSNESAQQFLNRL